jgi:hypothetical protein
MNATQATTPTTLPTHTIPLNNPSCAHAPSNPPALAQRKHHIPLYNAATPNETICIMRQPHSKQRRAPEQQHNTSHASLTAKMLPPKLACCSWVGVRVT